MPWLIDKIKSIKIGNKKNKVESKTPQVLGGLFTTPQVKKAANATYVNCVNALSRHASLIEPEVYNPDRDLRNLAYLNDLLQLEPNVMQDGSSFWSAVAHEYYFYGLSLIYIDWDHTTRIADSRVKALWPIANSNFSQIRMVDNDVYIQFSLGGERVCDKLENFIILCRDPHSDDPYNTHDDSLDMALEIMATYDEGLIRAIQNASLLRFIVRTPTLLNDDVLQEAQSNIEERLKQAQQVFYVTGAEEVQAVTNSNTWKTVDDIKDVKQEIYGHFGINEDFLISSNDEYGYQMVYQGALQPLYNAISKQLNLKLLSKRERACGNRIRIKNNQLQNASLERKIEVAEVYCQLPSIVPNIVCDLLDMPRTKSGDREVQSLNYVNSQYADAYQMGTSASEDGESEKDEPQQQTMPTEDSTIAPSTADETEDEEEEEEEEEKDDSESDEEDEDEEEEEKDDSESDEEGEDKKKKKKKGESK